MLFKRILFAVLIGVLFIPLFQNNLNIFKIKPLAGAISYTRDTNITKTGWFSGTYQDRKNCYLKEAFGFRNTFIRLNNQISYDLFQKGWNNGLVVGKHDYSYELPYVKAYCGIDFLGIDSIRSISQKLKFIQDTLAKLNKTFILFLAPGKGSYFPEYLPDEYKDIKGPTNYEYYSKFAKEFGINCIDFRKYFIEHKNTSKYPLYPHYGIHWSEYGECLAADTIVKTIEHLRNIKMPHMYWDQIVMEDPSEPEKDIENSMDLLMDFKIDFKMGHPKYYFLPDSDKTRPSEIVVSDSYYWGIFNFGISQIYKKNHFWYYNKEIYPENFYNKFTTDMINLKNEIAQTDIIIIMCTDANLPHLGWRFIDQAYNLFKSKRST